MHNPSYEELLRADGLVVLAVEDNRVIGGAVVTQPPEALSTLQQHALIARQVHMRVRGWVSE